MRGTCENSLLTAKVTTLFPGPKRDNGRAGKVYIKAGRAEDQPPSPLTDDAPQRSRHWPAGLGLPTLTSQGRPAPTAALPPLRGTSQRPLIC